MTSMRYIYVCMYVFSNDNAGEKCNLIIPIQEKNHSLFITRKYNRNEIYKKRKTCFQKFLFLAFYFIFLICLWSCSTLPKIDLKSSLRQILPVCLQRVWKLTDKNHPFFKMRIGQNSLKPIEIIKR